MSSGPVIGMELVGQDMIKKWRMFIGPTNCNTAREKAPQSLRAIFGKEGCRNAAHGSDAIKSAERELNFFFNEIPNNHRFLQNSNLTCGVIKPHIIKEGKLGAIVELL